MIKAVYNTVFFFNPSSGPKFNSAMRGKIGLPHSMKIRFCLTFFNDGFNGLY